MPKISEYDLGEPLQDDDQLVIARSGNNFRIRGSAIKTKHIVSNCILATDASHAMNDFNGVPFSVAYRNLSDDPSGNYTLSYARSAKVVASFTDVTTQKIRPLFYLSGNPSDISDIPSDWQTLMESWGASPSLGWTYVYSALVIQALTGTDADHYNVLELDRTTFKPLSDLFVWGKPMVFTSPGHGGSNLTVSVDGTSGEITLPSNGVYSISFQPNIDIYWPA